MIITNDGIHGRRSGLNKTVGILRPDRGGTDFPRLPGILIVIKPTNGN